MATSKFDYQAVAASMANVAIRLGAVTPQEVSDAAERWIESARQIGGAVQGAIDMGWDLSVPVAAEQLRQILSLKENCDHLDKQDGRIYNTLVRHLANLLDDTTGLNAGGKEDGIVAWHLQRNQK